MSTQKENFMRVICFVAFSDARVLDFNLGGGVKFFSIFGDC